MSMKLYSAQELYKRLSTADECVWIEAKGKRDSVQSLMESVCSFSNEPGLGGGFYRGLCSLYARRFASPLKK